MGGERGGRERGGEEIEDKYDVRNWVKNMIWNKSYHLSPFKSFNEDNGWKGQSWIQKSRIMA